jgi:uncharacterized membrane protein
MKRLTYLTCTLAVAVLVAAMIGWSMAAGNFFVPVIAIPLGVIVVLACRRNVQEVIADERLNKVRSQAALRTLEVAIIIGAIAAVILYSFMISDTLSPKITGRVYTNENGTSSMIINLYKPGSPETPENLIRSTTIENINSMNEAEAMDYCQFRREAFQENERNGIAGTVIGISLFALLATFGAFYLYYDRKY